MLSARFRRAAAPTCWSVSFAEKLRPLTGKNVIVENRAGAGGNIAQEYVGTFEARRLYDFHPCRQRGCSQRLDVEEASFPGRRQGVPDCGDDQSSAVHDGG